MARRFYFTNEAGENVLPDHVGNVKGAMNRAEKAAKELHENIYINDCETENIIDVAFK